MKYHRDHFNWAQSKFTPSTLYAASMRKVKQDLKWERFVDRFRSRLHGFVEYNVYILLNTNLGKRLFGGGICLNFSASYGVHNGKCLSIQHKCSKVHVYVLVDIKWLWSVEIIFTYMNVSSTGTDRKNCCTSWQKAFQI